MIINNLWNLIYRKPCYHLTTFFSLPFKGLNINFRPSTSLKEKLQNVDLELDGIWKCIDLTADEKVYQRINQNHDGGVELPDDGGDDETVDPNNPGDDFVG
jgi:hypothetical protein